MVHDIIRDTTRVYAMHDAYGQKNMVDIPAGEHTLSTTCMKTCTTSLVYNVGRNLQINPSNQWSPRPSLVPSLHSSKVLLVLRRLRLGLSIPTMLGVCIVTRTMLPFKRITKQKIPPN